MYHRTDSLAALVNIDLQKATDDRDLTRRLARNGLGYTDNACGRILITLPQRLELFSIGPPKQAQLRLVPGLEL